MKIKYREGYKYQMAEDISIETGIVLPSTVSNQFILLSSTGQLIVKSGYAWDGASKPAIDRMTNRGPSLPHDAMYQLGRELLLPAEFRAIADALFRDMCIANGMWKWVAWGEYYALRAFAGFAYKPRANETKEAPL
jgi:hypothetical protein